jgi:UDP-glucose 4-epimerase
MYQRLYGVQARILRVANAYGPFQPVGRGQGVIGAFIERVVRDEPVVMFGSGRTVRDYIHIDDVARAVAASLTKQMPSPLNIGTGVGTSLLQIVSLLEDITHRRVSVEHRPARGFDVESIVLDVGGYRALTGEEPIELGAGVADAYVKMLSPLRDMLSARSGRRP